ncbi:hypothetical protein CALCODRAFT_479781 [Calocera cornea HHB12733]|uniref:Uncharacterized protein n=1 Tax=Calocera cornea HHB12733 TaxID=1353952 RepID=A0A165J847_9BASI|nr:hypothetical protein CALCODRAFT_479781 [Calocera cornea HHB12733]
MEFLKNWFERMYGLGHLLSRKVTKISVVVLLVACMVFMAEQYITAALNPVWSIGFIPGSSSKALSQTAGSVQPNFDRLVLVQLQLQTAIEDSVNVAPAAQMLQTVEMTLCDLVGLLKAHDIGYKDDILDQVRALATLQRKAAYSVQCFMSAIRDMVKHLLTIDEHTLLKLQHLESTSTMTVVTKDTLAKLILEGEGLLELMDQDLESASIDELLRMLIRLEETAMVQGTEERQQVLKGVWTVLGGTESQHTSSHVSRWWTRQSIEGQPENSKFNQGLLHNMATCRMQAHNATQSTLKSIRKVAAELKHLPDQTATKLLAGKAANIPLAIHIESIQKGLKGMREMCSSANANVRASTMELADGVP